MDVGSHYLADIAARYRDLKKLAEDAVAQVTDEDLFAAPDPESNSIAVVMRHVAGNLKSRFTNFLTSDGEKPDRHRDAEFEIPAGTTRETLLADWNLAFSRLFGTLETLTSADLLAEITIRGTAHTVVQALDRSVTHLAYHVGQIVYAARHVRGERWRTLSIPKRRSAGTR
jgi:hypothetical protein